MPAKRSVVAAEETVTVKKARTEVGSSKSKTVTKRVSKAGKKPPREHKWMETVDSDEGGQSGDEAERTMKGKAKTKVVEEPRGKGKAMTMGGKAGETGEDTPKAVASVRVRLCPTLLLLTAI